MKYSVLKGGKEMSHRPVCVKCGIEMRLKEDGVGCLDLTEKQKPCQIWDSDMYKCPLCGIEILTDFGQLPVATRHEKGFAETVALWRKHFSIVENKKDDIRSK